jgi:two-component sensor histidine kinase
MKKGIFLLFLTSFYLQVPAQNVPGFRMPIPGEESELLAKLEKSKPGIAQIDLLLELGLYYVRLPGEENVDLQRGFSLADRARVLAVQFNYHDGYNASFILKGTAWLETEDYDMARKVLDSAIANVHKEWKNKKSAELPERKLRLLMQLGDSYLAESKCNEAEKYYLEAIALCKTNGFKNLHYIHDRLGVLFQIKGDWNAAMYYQLEAIKSMETTGDMVSAGWFYHRMGIIYRAIGQYQKAVEYYELAYSYYKSKPSGVFLELGTATAESLAKIERAKDGITQMLEKCALYPPKSNFDRRYIESALGNCYLELKQFDSAELHLLNVIKYRNEDRLFNFLDIKIRLGQTYVGWGKYKKAKPYLDECLASGIFSMTGLARLYYLLYKVDSATGNYVRAIDYLLKHKDVENEIYKEAKIRATGELQIKYETDKKDREIRIKEQDILLKQAELKTVSWLKDVTLVGILMLFIILGLLYNQYRIKQKSNKEISSKNLTLEHLLEEKEWLLKEVHHRVKNNLHTIMSLLQSQSAYLKDDALRAVQNSQHRVYAMSLIHQKLYQNEESTINMMLYLPELLEYLRDSFDIKQQIQITTDIRDIHLDISKAIPVGLILNEAVTNAIKYAFPNSRRGEITIGMERIADKRIRLSIADNGIGMPGNWNKMQRDSLGLRLMKGLSDDVRGDFSINNTNGTRITVEFQEELFYFEPGKARKKTGEPNS